MGLEISSTAATASI